MVKVDTCANRQNWKQTTQSLLMNLCLASNTHVCGNLTNLAPGTRSGTHSKDHNWPNRTNARFTCIQTADLTESQVHALLMTRIKTSHIIQIDVFSVLACLAETIANLSFVGIILSTCGPCANVGVGILWVC